MFLLEIIIKISALKAKHLCLVLTQGEDIKNLLTPNFHCVFFYELTATGFFHEFETCVCNTLERLFA